MRMIALEEHYRAPAIRDAGAASSAPAARPFASLDEIGDERLAAMDAAGIDVQVLSHTAPGAERFDAERAVPLALAANEYLAGAIASHPDRFAGFATLPMPAPAAAADELERTVAELGFKGAMINGHTGGAFLDDRSFWPIFERAEALDVPIYLHPSAPPASVRGAYYGGLEPAAAQLLATSAWGWHVEVGLHVLRMIVGGVFDQFPNLQLIIGHMGEALPFMLARSSRKLVEGGALRRPLEEYFGANVHVTTSGMFTHPPLLLLLQVVGVDRVMFSVDYPHARNEDGARFLLSAPLSAADREQIAHRNAERLLRLGR
jgi:predicted TIM-barrel fold metal-dependent hydrolase